MECLIEMLGDLVVSLVRYIAHHWISIATMVGEWGIVAAIYLEWESNRLDHFLADVESKHDERALIFKAYCALSSVSSNEKGECFKKLLDDPQNEKLKNACDDNVRLLSRIGARIPFWPFRRRALEWHVVVLLWEILGPYVERRRKEAGPSFARWFLTYALKSIGNLLSQHRVEWIIADPDVGRRQNVILTRARLIELQSNLKKNLEMS
jgi:hypothetical protein